jgi:DNA adenine methylase
MKSSSLQKKIHDADLYTEDFEKFLNLTKPSKDDFIFLDPPYDTDFSTYANNEFEKNDQKRLADYMLKTKANFMLIIKNTDFIFDLYDKKGIYIKSFDKKYVVSFKNRNEKDVTHLLITNYEL